MTVQKLELPLGEISSLCSRYHVHELAIFGSFQRGESRPESDIDFLVDFLPEAEIGFLALSKMQRELAELLHRAVDLVPKAGLKPAIRKEILADAYVIYAV